MASCSGCSLLIYVALSCTHNAVSIPDTFSTPDQALHQVPATATAALAPCHARPPKTLTCCTNFGILLHQREAITMTDRTKACARTIETVDHVCITVTSKLLNV